MTIAAVMPLLQRAQMLHQQGRTGEAWITIAPLRQAIDGHGQALRLYALIAAAVGRTDEAVAAMQRILVLEREPPEMLGALADLLGNAGRHGEALAFWDRLVTVRPDLADAHLNRAITASNAGNHALAVEAADAGLKRFPGHARLLAAKAMALKNAGRIEESLDCFDKAVAAEPGRALTRHNQAVALRAARRFDEACSTYAEAARLGMDGAQFHANWAAAALEAGDVPRAVDLYERALKDDPQHDETLQALTRIHIEYRTGEDPFGHFANLAGLKPEDPNVWIRWANALALNRDYAAAAKVAADGARRHPASADLPLLVLFSEGMAGDPAAAARELVSRLADQPNNELLWATVSQLALRGGIPEAAERAASRLVDKYPYHQSGWSILGLAWRVLGDDREHWLCDYERLVMAVDVTPPDGELSPAEYADVIAGALLKRHNTLAAPGNQSLRHGTQTGGALFDDPDPLIQQFREAVSIAAARAVATLPDDPAHPFLSRKSDKFRFSGSWSVRLQSGGGHHVPHFHSEGWMSSAYYAQLPPADQESRSRREGWIEFGRPPAIFNLDLEPRRVIEPAVGRLVLFPSYMWHGTVPFGRGERLTAAFDYQPLD